ncbi:MAG: tail fiber domain-containing protein [bacterium]|nr:tail fiber domain-containing protein [bacterium]
MKSLRLKKSFSTGILTVLIAGFVFVAGMWGQSSRVPGENPIAEVVIGPFGIEFSPIVSYKQLVLNVSFPEGQVIRKVFEAGTTPRLDLSGSLGAPVTDGMYAYELRVVPVSNEKVRAENDGLDVSTTQGPVQSGHFLVANGGIVPQVGEEPVAIAQPNPLPPELSGTQAACYIDDMVVNSSLCVGNSCTCNYSFGLDTLVFMETALRVFYNDTSVSPYPRNDWRILINDISSGGASYYSVEDATADRRVFTLEAGARTNSLYVDDNGRVGFGTSTPAEDLHIVVGDTPTIRLEQDSSSSFTPQTWELAGNEGNFFIEDVTANEMPFRIQPGAPENSIGIKSNGRVGFGTWSPSFPLHLLTDSSTNASMVLQRTSGSQAIVTGGNSGVNMGSQSNHELRFVTNAVTRMTLNTSGGITMATGGGTYNQATGQWVNGSSRAYKENINELTSESAMDAINKLKPVTFNFKKSDEHQVGFIAEEVPELVAQKNRKGLSPMDIVAVLTKVVQQQQKQMAEQKNTIDQMKKRIEQIEKDSK